MASASVASRAAGGEQPATSRSRRQQTAASAYCRARRSVIASERRLSILTVAGDRTRRRFTHLHGTPERVARANIQTAARVDAAERERLARIARRIRSSARQGQQPRGERRERHQIEPVVLEDRCERTRVPAPDELEIAFRNLEARHITAPPHPEDLPLERL